MTSNKEAQKNKDPLHGITLEKMVTSLYEAYGWQKLGEQINIKCFTNEPSITSSLKLIRKTPWARKKVEDFYLYSVRKGIIRKD